MISMHIQLNLLDCNLRRLEHDSELSLTMIRWSKELSEFQGMVNEVPSIDILRTCCLCGKDTESSTRI